MSYKQLSEIHSGTTKLEDPFSNHSLKYIYIEDENSIIIKLNNSLLKIPNIDYQYRNIVYENIDLDNCVFVDNEYLDKILDNMFK